MTDILITGEGLTDYGWKSFGSDNWHEGAAPYCSGDALKPSCGKKETVMNLNLHFADRKDVEAFKLQRSLNYHSLKGKSIPALRFYMLGAVHK